VASIGIFALLIGLMPSALFEHQADYQTPYGGQDQEVIDYFNARNITLYKSTWPFNLTFAYGDVMEVLEDVPTTDHQIEFHGQQDIYGAKTIHVRHASPSWFFGLWLEYHYLDLTEPYFSRSGEAVPWLIHWSGIEALQLDTNSSYFEMRCEHLTINFVVLNLGDYATLEDSWNAGEITVLSSYEIDFDAMKPSAFNLIAQLITFQNPDFGVPGDFGTIINYSFGISFWITIALIIYTIVTKLIPTIQGGLEN